MTFLLYSTFQLLYAFGMTFLYFSGANYINKTLKINYASAILTIYLQ